MPRAGPMKGGSDGVWAGGPRVRGQATGAGTADPRGEAAPNGHGAGTQNARGYRQSMH